MLFLYRPRQTWMPFALPRSRTDQAAYNRQLQAKFEATRRAPPAVPAPGQRDPIAQLQQLGDLHRAGMLTDAEFEAAKTDLLGR
jgi:hypothetical protein